MRRVYMNELINFFDKVFKLLKNLSKDDMSIASDALVDLVNVSVETMLNEISADGAIKNLQSDAFVVGGCKW
ncbi:unnamed protein product [Arabis nemorensis]|uniref:Uncharacterized protein n=1 Tax=Arabis nemorensis TaxID=586526 RepID=A0A565C5S0_9BRAS|nr:unnamed protein product [Arabis nemorensis]